jgi:hypothetical protein
MTIISRARSVFPSKVRGTADPSASLGMTKERAMVSWRVVAGPRGFSSPWISQRPRTTPVEMTNQRCVSTPQ